MLVCYHRYVSLSVILSVCQFNLVFSIANTETARDRKQARYAYLKEDIEERGFHCFNNPLEIGTRAI